MQKRILFTCVEGVHRSGDAKTEFEAYLSKLGKQNEFECTTCAFTPARQSTVDAFLERARMADHVVVAAKEIYAHVSRAMVGNEVPARRMGLARFETPLAL